MKKRIIKVTIYSLVGALCLLGILHVPPVQSLIFKYAIKKLREATGISIKADSAKYNLLKWKISAENLTVSKEENKNQKLVPFLKVKHITVEIPFPLSWKHSLHLRKALIFEPEIQLITYADGSTNFSFKSETSSKEPPTGTPQFLIEQLKIENARLRYQSQPAATTVNIPGITTILKGKPNNNHSLSLKIQKQGYIIIKNQKLPIDNVFIQALQNNQNIEISNCTVHSGRNQFEANGTINGIGTKTPNWDIDSKFTCFNEDLSPFLPQLEKFSGKLNATTHLHGLIENPTITVNISGKDFIIPSPINSIVTGDAALTLKGYSFDQVSGTGNFQLQKTTSFPTLAKPKGIPLQGNVSFEIQSKKINAEIHHLTIADAIIDGKLDSNLQNLKGKIRIEIPHLEKSQSLLQETPFLSRDTEWVSRISKAGIKGNGIVQLTISDTIEKPKINAQLHSSLQLNEDPPIILDGNIRYIDKTLHIDTMEYRQDHGKITISATIPLQSATKAKKKPQPIQLAIIGKNVNTSTLQSLVTDQLPNNTILSIDSNITIIPEKNIINARINQLEIQSGEHLLTGKEPFQLLVEDSKISVENLQLAGNGTVVQLNGDMLLNANNTISTNPLTINAQLDCHLLQAFLPDVSAEGILKISGKMQGSMSNPQIEGQLGLEGGGVAIKSIPAPIENISIQLGVSLDRITIDSITFDWKGTQFSLKGKLPLTAFNNSNFPRKNTISTENAEDISLILAIRNFSDKVLENILPTDLGEKLSGTMEADIQINGKHFTLNELNGNADIRNFQASIDGFTFRQQEPLSFNLTNGIISLENLALTGPNSYLNGKGKLELKENFPIQLRLEGEINSKILDTFSEDITFSGSNLLHFLVEGDISKPQFSGEIITQNGGMQHRLHNLFISHMKGSVKIVNDRIFTEKPIIGSFNGGDISVSLGDDGWTFSFQRAQMDIPWGLQSLVSGKLIMTPVPGSNVYRISGNIPITNGSYTESIGLNSRLYDYIKQISGQPSIQTIDQDETPIEFNINIFTEKPVQVENNMIKAEISTAFTLSGTNINPTLSGRAEIKEGGELYLGKNTFYIERGTINLINPYRIEPELDISGKTQVANTEIRLNISGPIQAITASLSSTPPLPESHIIALLVSGKPMESNSPTTLSKVGNQTLGYLESVLSGKLEQAVKNTLGLETVRIDGSLIAATENPSARLTIGHHLTSNLEVIMSQNLRQSQERTWIVNYNPLPGVNLQATRQDNNAYTLGINNEIHFGLKDQESTPNSKSKKSSRNKSQKIGNLQITGNLVFPEKAIKRRLSLKKGKPFRFFQLQKDINRIKKFYHKNNYLEVDITARKEEDKNKVNIVLEIEAGPQIFIEFQGIQASKKIQEKAKKIWIDSHFNEKRLEAIEQLLKLCLYKKGYIHLVIENSETNNSVLPETRGISVDTSTGETTQKHVVFHVEKGLHFKKLRIHFKGNRYRPESHLVKMLKHAKLVPSVILKPEKSIQYLEQWYRQNGFISVKIDPPSILWQKEKRQLEATITIDEGTRYKLGKISFEGNRFLETPVLEKSIKRIKPGMFFYPPAIINEVASLESVYAHNGFYNTRVSVRQQIHKDSRTVDIVFIVQESYRNRIEEIRFQENRITDKKTIQRALLFKVGDLLDLKNLNKSQKKLYDLAVFKRVNLQIKPVGEKIQETGEQKSIVEVNVTENKPFQLKYGLQWDSEAGIGTVGEFTNVNSWGKAILLGTSFRYNRLEKNLKFFTRLPYFLGNPIPTELYLFFSREKETLESETIQRAGITLQQQLKLSSKSLLSFSYTFERYQGKTEANLGHLTASFTFDTRDSFWNATRGIFLSQSYQYAGKILGSQLEFSKYLGQFNLYKKIIPRLVSATSIHLGLGDALGQELLPGERFFAGGSTTLRGFKYNSVGPTDPVTLEPNGGEALFLFKQELRYQLFSGLSTVIFLDMGNVYPTVSTFNLFNTREAAGFGLRYNLFGVLLRADWGFKLDRRPGESASHIFLSIGQSF